MADEQKTFEIGQLVRLRSGGLTMTVRCQDEKGVACAWFEPTTGLWGGGREALSHYSFAPAMLESAELAT